MNAPKDEGDERHLLYLLGVSKVPEELVTCQPINNINPMWSGNGPIKTIDSPGYAEALRLAQQEDATLGIRNIYGTRSSKLTRSAAIASYSAAALKNTINYL